MIKTDELNHPVYINRGRDSEVCQGFGAFSLARLNAVVGSTLLLLAVPILSKRRLLLLTSPASDGRWNYYNT